MRATKFVQAAFNEATANQSGVTVQEEERNAIARQPVRTMRQVYGCGNI